MDADKIFQKKYVVAKKLNTNDLENARHIAGTITALEEEIRSVKKKDKPEPIFNKGFLKNHWCPNEIVLKSWERITAKYETIVVTEFETAIREEIDKLKEVLLKVYNVEYVPPKPKDPGEEHKLPNIEINNGVITYDGEEVTIIDPTKL